MPTPESPSSVAPAPILATTSWPAAIPSQTPTAPAPKGIYGVLDASTPEIQVGLWDLSENRWRGYASTPLCALEGLFTLIENVHQTESTPLETLEGFLYCEGPGSVLGLRILQITLEAWTVALQKPFIRYTYRSLDWAAQVLRRQISPPFSIVTEYKQGEWKHLHVASVSGPLPEPEVCPAAAFAQAPPYPLYHLAMRKNWAPLACPCLPLHYSIECMPEVGWHTDWVRPESAAASSFNVKMPATATFPST